MPIPSSLPECRILSLRAMKKLIQGILQFRETQRQGLAETFGKLALGQQPDALFIACSDSRVAVNVFASTDPGDLFVLRNVGNLVPPFGHPGGAGTAAAVDFAVDTLRVRDIIVCGHSDCGAIAAVHRGPDLPDGPLKDWLAMGAVDAADTDRNVTSRRNVLAQLEHLRGYPSVAKAMAERHLCLHGMWFDIRHLDVLYHDESARVWLVLDAENGERILGRIVSGQTE
jgi:carbonic anhydrase